jgi:hypothetical protein
MSDPQSPRYRGTIKLIIRCLSPLRHGEGTVGNVQMFRRQSIAMADGSVEKVPYLSGNSIKHFLRENAALFALHALGATDGRLSKEQLQLLFSGGALTKGGQSVRLDVARDWERAMPFMGLCGYAAGNVMTSSAMRVNNALLVCSQTRDILEADVDAYASNYESLFERMAESYLCEGFGTRHEPTRQSHLAALMQQEARLEEARAMGESMTEKHADKRDSAQMIYSYESLMAGSVLIGSVAFPHGITEGELQAFRSAWVYASEGHTSMGELIVNFGAASSKGYGRCAVKLVGYLAEGIRPLTYTHTDELAPSRGEGSDYDPKLLQYIEQLRADYEVGQAAVKELL